MKRLIMLTTIAVSLLTAGPALARFTHICPIFIIEEYADGSVLYYADKYPNGCGPDYQAGVLFGNYELVTECGPGCVTPPVDPSSGLHVRASLDHALETGTVAARAFDDPLLSFIQFRHDDGTAVRHVVAKVNAVEIDGDRVGVGPAGTRIVYVALECAQTLSGVKVMNVDDREVQRLENYDHGYVVRIAHPATLEEVQIVVIVEGQDRD